MIAIIFLLISVVVAFFMKGEVSNKVIAVIFFVAGILCFEASSFWWRIGFVVFTLCLCDSGDKYRKDDKPYMVVALTIVVMCLVRLLCTDLFDCHPVWIYNILAGAGSVVYLLNAKN